MKHLIALLCLLMSAVIADVQFDFANNTYGIGWWSDNKQLDRCSLQYAVNPQTGKRGLHAQWDASITNYMHVMITDKAVMPSFQRARFTAVVTNNLPCRVFDCQLRIQDKNLETYYFSHPVDWTAPGTHTLDYVIDLNHLRPTSKTTFSKDVNGIIDFPLSTFALTLRMPQDDIPGDVYVESITVTELPQLPQQTYAPYPSVALAQSWAKPLELPQRLPDNAVLETAANPINGKPSLKMTFIPGKSSSFGVAFTTTSSPRGILGPKIRHYESAVATFHVTTVAPMPDIKTMLLRWFETNGGLCDVSVPVDFSQPGQHDILYELPKTITANIPYSKEKDGQLWVLTSVRFKTDSKDAPLSDKPIYFDAVDMDVTRSPLENIEFTLDTGKEARVIETPDAANGVKAHLHNIAADNLIDCHLKGTLTDCDGHEFPWGLDTTLSLPAGETIILPPVPVPEPYGVYYATITVSAKDLPDHVIKRSFAHVRLTGATPDEKFVKGFKFGSVCHLNPMVRAPQEIERAAIIMSQIGLRILRVDTGGISNPDIRQWLDNVVEIFSKYGMNFDFILGMQAREDKILLEQSLKTYGDMFRRYKGKVQYWEMLNEPDIPWGRKKPPQGEEYARAARATGELLRSIDPQAQFMSAGYCQLEKGNALLPGFHPISMALCKDVFDVHCFHGHGPFDRYANVTIDQHLLPMRKRLGLTMPWYANETAITSTGGCTEKEQAETLYKKLLFSWGRGAIGYTWYNLRSKGELPYNGEFNYGMLTHELYPKPVYAAYNALTGLYRDKTYFKTFELPADQYGFAFKNQNDIVVAVWNQGVPAALAIKTDATSAEISDIFGNRKPLAIANGVITLTSNKSPKNIILHDAKDCQALPPFTHVSMPSLLYPGQETPVTVSITNPLDKPRQATVNLTIPDYLTCPKTVFTGSIPAGQSLTFKTTVTLKDTATMSLGSTTFVYLETKLEGITPAHECIKLPVPFIFRQSLSGPPLFTLDSAKYVTNLHHGDPAFIDSNWKGPNDLSADLWLSLRPDGALVVKIIATDDQHCQNNAADMKLWNGDSVQIFITQQSAQSPFEINLARGAKGTSLIDIHSTPQEANTDVSKISMTTSREGQKTTYLITIPPDALGLQADAFRVPFRFNVMVNDGDNNVREGWIALAPGIGNGVRIASHPFVLAK